MYKKNEFKAYRALTKIHLGSLNDSLNKDEVVDFDGFVLKRDGKEYSLSSLQAAIKVGWLVPDESLQTSDDYRPKSADVKMGEAVSKGEKRTLKTSGVVVQHDEQDVGQLSTIRGYKALPIHDSKNSGNLIKKAVVQSDSDGVIVGRFKTSAKNGPVEIGKDDRQVVQQLDNLKAKASGDVEHAMVGEELEDILPEAVSANRPRPGVAGEGRGDESGSRARAILARGSSSVGTESDGEIVGKVAHADPVVVESPEAIQKAKLAVAQALIPGFEWDFGGMWMTRAKKAVDLYRDKPDMLKGVLAIEIPVVQKSILKWTTQS